MMTRGELFQISQQERIFANREVFSWDLWEPSGDGVPVSDTRVTTLLPYPSPDHRDSTNRSIIAFFVVSVVPLPIFVRRVVDWHCRHSKGFLVLFLLAKAAVATNTVRGPSNTPACWRPLWNGFNVFGVRCTCQCCTTVLTCVFLTWGRRDGSVVYHGSRRLK